MNIGALGSGITTNTHAHAQHRLLAYISSQIRRAKTLVSEMNEEELLSGIDIQELGLQESIAAKLHCEGIHSVWDLIWYDKEKLLNHPQIGPSGLKQIDEQLGLLGLTMPD